jgi:hypothetical protein
MVGSMGEASKRNITQRLQGKSARATSTYWGYHGAMNQMAYVRGGMPTPRARWPKEMWQQTSRPDASPAAGEHKSTRAEANGEGCFFLGNLWFPCQKIHVFGIGASKVSSSSYNALKICTCVRARIPSNVRSYAKIWAKTACC